MIAKKWLIGWIFTLAIAGAAHAQNPKPLYADVWGRDLPKPNDHYSYSSPTYIGVYYEENDVFLFAINYTNALESKTHIVLPEERKNYWLMSLGTGRVWVQDHAIAHAAHLNLIAIASDQNLGKKEEWDFDINEHHRLFHLPEHNIDDDPDRGTRGSSPLWPEWRFATGSIFNAYEGSRHELYGYLHAYYRAYPNAPERAFEYKLFYKPESEGKNKSRQWRTASIWLYMLPDQSLLAIDRLDGFAIRFKLDPRQGLSSPGLDHKRFQLVKSAEFVSQFGKPVLSDSSENLERVSAWLNNRQPPKH